MGVCPLCWLLIVATPLAITRPLAGEFPGELLRARADSEALGSVLQVRLFQHGLFA